MKSFLGGSRALQRQLYMRYPTTWTEEWENHFERELQEAVTFVESQERSQAILQPNGRNRLKEITDALQP